VALVDRVQERFSTPLLVQLTNVETPGATTVNAVYLARLCDDAEAEFADRVGQTYDETIRSHVKCACMIVKMLACEYGAAADEAMETLRERVEKLCQSVAEVRARDRVSPTSSSHLTPSDEVTGTSQVKPKFDDSEFDDLIPGSDSVTEELD
jgi:hypothetical protein